MVATRSQVLMSYPRYVASQSKRELVKTPEERKKKTLPSRHHVSLDLQLTSGPL